MLEVLLTVLTLLVIAVLLLRKQKEHFASTSPGTLVQLQTSHVPTEEDWLFYTNVYPKMVRREITNMTGGDPGPLAY